MRGRTRKFLIAAAGLVMALAPAAAHHGNTNYDMKKTISLNGTITAFDWSNPHCLIYLDVADENGSVWHWTLEMASTLAMAHEGWTKNSASP